MKIFKQGTSLNKIVFWPPFLLPFAAVALSFINEAAFAAVMNNTYAWIANNFDWLFSILALFFVLICVIIFISPIGKVRFGGKDAKPRYSFLVWFAMSLCGGIAIGITFWGVAEPVTHMMAPPAGIQPGSPEAIVFSMSSVFLHWSFTPYSFFAICSVAIALAAYNYGQKMTISSGLYFLIGDKCNGIIGKVVDAICLFALAGSISTSLGTGVMQISSGLQSVFGVNPSIFIWLIVDIVIVGGFLTSSMLGVDKGIKWLSNQNLKFYIILMLFIFIFGPTAYICQIGVEGIGAYLGTFFEKSAFLGAAVGDNSWSHSWTTYYWAWWLGAAPVVGVFLARLCYGRTIREFLAVNFIGPSVFGILWFSIMGGTAIDMQHSGAFDIWGAIQTYGMESAVFQFLAQFPLGLLLSIFFLIISAASFITMADSMTYVAAVMSTNGMRNEEEPPQLMKAIWGLTMGSLAWVMICFAGIVGTKMLPVVAAFPLLLVVFALGCSIIRGLYSENGKQGIPIKINFSAKEEKAKRLIK